MRKIQYGSVLLDRYRGNILVSATKTNVTIEKDGETYSAGTRNLPVGTYTVTATPRGTAELTTLEVNGNPFVSGSTIDISFGGNLNVVAVSEGGGLEPGLYETGTENLIKDWDTFVSDNGLTFDSTTGTLTGNDTYKNDAGDLIISDDVKIIGNKAFAYFNYLTNITIPDGVTELGEQALQSLGYYITGGIDVTLPDSITTIGWSAFRGSHIKSINIPEGVTTLDGNTFDQCYMLRRISLPHTLEYIGFAAFRGVGNTIVTYNGTIAEWESIEKHTSWNPFDDIRVIHCTDGDIGESRITGTVKFSDYITGTSTSSPATFTDSNGIHWTIEVNGGSNTITRSTNYISLSSTSRVPTSARIYTNDISKIDSFSIGVSAGSSATATGTAHLKYDNVENASLSYVGSTEQTLSSVSGADINNILEITFDNISGRSPRAYSMTYTIDFNE